MTKTNTVLWKKALRGLRIWLREMVNGRLPDKVSVDDLFETGEMRGSIAPFNYIVKRTFCGRVK